MIRLLTSYSKDKREKEAKYWFLSQRVKGQPFCNFLIALYFWQNIFTPLNHRCIQLCKQMKDDDKKTPRTSKDKKLLVKVSNGCFPIELCVFIIFLWILQALALRTCSLLLKFCELSMFLEYSLFYCIDYFTCIVPERWDIVQVMQFLQIDLPKFRFTELGSKSAIQLCNKMHNFYQCQKAYVPVFHKLIL